MIVTAVSAEQVIKLAHLRQYIRSHEGRMHNFWIQMSGCATMITRWLTLGLEAGMAGSSSR
jgi:hypothetical protein